MLTDGETARTAVVTHGEGENELKYNVQKPVAFYKDQKTSLIFNPAVSIYVLSAIHITLDVNKSLLL